MTGYVASEVFGVAIPATIRLCFRFKSGSLAEKGEHAVGFEFEQVLGIEILSVFERTARETDV
jgi:hypothetical protein